jgi:HTH-type transcriptional regulator/antitoxin HigA
MSQNLKPAFVPPPGNIIKRELEARGWTQNDLADIMERPAQAISEIINGTKQITPETSIELSQAFGTTPEFWLNLEGNYRIFLARKKDEETQKQKDKNISRKSRLYSLAPIAELQKRSWIGKTNSIDDLEAEVCKFLGINSINDTPQISLSLRQSKEREPELNTQIAWFKRVEFLAKAQEVSSFSLEKLKNAIPEILDLTNKVEGVIHIPNKLMSLGIHFLIVKHLPKTYIDGATFFLNENPVIVLTLRYDRIDAFWFTVLHELAHILLVHEEVHLDTLYGNEKEKESDQQEEEANKCARQWLIDSATFQIFVQENYPYFSKQKVESFANSLKRHAGIVVGQLQYYEVIGYNHLRGELTKVSPLLMNWLDVSSPNEDFFAW